MIRGFREWHALSVFKFKWNNRIALTAAANDAPEPRASLEGIYSLRPTPEVEEEPRSRPLRRR